MLEIVSFASGPFQTNAYLIADGLTGEAAVIDPAWDGQRILQAARSRGWRIAHLWYTHAHFDHLGAAAEIADALNPMPLVALHPADYPLWKIKGGASLFGIPLKDAGPEPTVELFDGQLLRLGQTILEVRHTPGHTPGHCVFYCAEAEVCFCGDLIFAGSVGRTDLPGGDWQSLEHSIHTRIFTLPERTRLLPGHGPETTVGEEKRDNPFVGLAAA